jgi:hypothetical protein
MPGDKEWKMSVFLRGIEDISGVSVMPGIKDGKRAYFFGGTYRSDKK